MDEAEDADVATAEEPGRSLRRSLGWAGIGKCVTARGAEPRAAEVPDGKPPFWEGRESFPRRPR
jgi:hypothetical protein